MLNEINTPNSTTRELNSLSIYYKDLRKFKPLSQEELFKLFKRKREGETKVINTIIKSNLRLVITIAKKYSNCGLELEDLISEGNIGLVNAIYHFDEHEGTKFSSYAAFWVKKEILRALENDSRTVRLPANHHRNINKYKSEVQKLRNQLGRNPFNHELNENVDFNVTEIESLLLEYGQITSLDMPFDDDENQFYTVISDSNCPMPDEELINQSENQYILTIINKLDPRFSETVKYFYGICKDREYTVEEISEILKISKATVRNRLETAKNSEILYRLCA